MMLYLCILIISCLGYLGPLIGGGGGGGALLLVDFKKCQVTFFVFFLAYHFPYPLLNLRKLMPIYII